jgi:hypothetical protein
MPRCIDCGKKEVDEGSWFCPECRQRREKGSVLEKRQRRIEDPGAPTQQSNSWFARHLNWTLVLVYLISTGLIFWAVYGQPTPTQAELSSGLSIYVDEDCSSIWTSTNTPDLVWGESTNGWQTANMVLYLKNNLGIPIQVRANHSSEEMLLGDTWVPRYAIPGLSISSDTVILEPHTSSPINIKIDQSLYSPGTGSIYFHIYSVATGSTNVTMITLIVVANIAVLCTEVWYLKRKRRSLFNLFWHLLSWIGFIVILSLENKAAAPLVKDGEGSSHR